MPKYNIGDLKGNDPDGNRVLLSVGRFPYPLTVVVSDEYDEPVSMREFHIAHEGYAYFYSLIAQSTFVHRWNGKEWELF